MILRLAGLRHLSRHPVQLLFGADRGGARRGGGLLDRPRERERPARLPHLRRHRRRQGDPPDRPGALRAAGGAVRDAPAARGNRGRSPRSSRGTPASRDAPGSSCTSSGIDPFAEAPFRDYTPETSAGADIPRLLTRPGAVHAPRGDGGAARDVAGGRLPLRVGMESAGRLPFRVPPAAGRSDPAGAGEHGRGGHLHRPGAPRHGGEAVPDRPEGPGGGRGGRAPSPGSAGCFPRERRSSPRPRAARPWTG